MWGVPHLDIFYQFLKKIYKGLTFLVSIASLNILDNRTKLSLIGTALGQTAGDETFIVCSFFPRLSDTHYITWTAQYPSPNSWSSLNGHHLTLDLWRT